MSTSTSQFLTAFKYKLLKVIDVAGLGFLSPVVRLCYGEEPAVQVRAIFQMIIVPLIAIAVFIAAWFVVSDKIKTKAGKLPDPTETATAYASIMTQHDREKSKEKAFTLEGSKRELTLEEANKRLAQLEPLATKADAELAETKAAFAAEIEQNAAPLVAEYDARKAEFAAAKTTRQSELKTLADSLTPGSNEGHNGYLSKVADHETLSASEKETLQAMKGAIDEVRNEKSKAVAAAIRSQTSIAEEKQYLMKVVDYVTTANRAIKVTKTSEAIDEKKQTFYNLSGPEAYTAARSITKGSARVDKVKSSEYAKPWTLPMQIVRSIVCVFAGFVLGSIIAIPIGIMCGLSPTFMAAMTPFIAIFKPVSPIVWLPIALIIVGGFIPDPDKNAFIQGLWDAPLIGWLKINPAFIASAITVALCSLWATLVNTALGVASIDEDHLNVARVLKLGFFSRLFKIVIPSALPLIFAGLRISLGVGWMVLIAAELLSSSEGLGKFVWDQFNNGASDSFAKMVVVVFVVGIIGLVLDRIMIIFQRLVSFDGSPTAI